MADDLSADALKARILRAQLATPPPQAPSRTERFGTGVMDRVVGLAQTGAHIAPDVSEAAALPFAPPGMPAQGELAAAVDQRVAQREAGIQAERRATGQTGTDWWRVAGNVTADIGLTAPLAAAGGGATGFIAGVMRGAGVGAVAGAVGGAAEPVTEGAFASGKARQVATGAVSGAVIGGALGGLGGAMAKNDPVEAERIIRSSYYRGTRPPAAMTAPERRVYDARARLAVEGILDSRPGQPIPRTPEEFSNAIAEAKPFFYQRYSGMEQAAEQAGVRVPLKPAADRLQRLANDALQDPASRSEARRLLAMIPGVNPTVTPGRASEIVAFLNQRSGDFAMTAKNAAAAMREAGAALREELITSVEASGQTGYGVARRTYGALAEIEDHVGSAAGRALRANGTALGLSEISAMGFAGAGEPIAAAGIETGKIWTRWLKSPNRAISALFDTAASLRRGPTVGERVGEALPAAIPGASAAPDLATKRDPARVAPLWQHPGTAGTASNIGIAPQSPF